MNLGKARLEEGWWIIDCQPHVSMHLKRCFEKIQKRPGLLVISDTPENCRNLEWFAQRFPLEFDPASYLEDRAEAHRADEARVQAIIHSHVPPPAFSLALPPREYQRTAAALCLEVGGLLLGDDLGLGKTVSAMCMMTDPRTLPALVVAQTHLPRQWADELKKFAPSLRVHVLKSGRPYDIVAEMAKERGRCKHVFSDLLGECFRCGAGREPREEGFPDVIVCNYHKLSGWADTMVKTVKIRLVVFDEVQELRHAGSDKTWAASCIADATPFRLGMSATPIYNYGAEIYQIFRILRPGALGEHAEFGREWCGGNTGPKGCLKDPEAFSAYTRQAGMMLRRTQAEVGRELPELTRVAHFVDADTRALDAIGDAASELAKIIMRGGAKGEAWKASEELSYLLRMHTGIAKAPFVADFVKMLLESGEKVLLGVWHREVYGIIMERLKAYNPVMYSGSESPAQKEASKQAFISGDSRVLLMSLRSGTGLNGLQETCRVVVFGELDWSPGVHEQFVGRVRRDGQANKVTAYFLIADSGSDPIVAKVCGIKKQQSDGFLGIGEAVQEVEPAETRVKMLAQAYLAQRGLSYEVEEGMEDGDTEEDPSTNGLPRAGD